MQTRSSWPPTAALEQSETGFRLLFESNPCPMWIYDFDTLEIVEANDSAAEQYGYTRDELRHMSVRDLRAGNDLSDPESTVQSMDFEAEGKHLGAHRRRDGSIIQVESRGRPLPTPGRRLRLVVAINVTEQLGAALSAREAEARAQSTAEMLRALIAAVPQAMVVVDEDFRVTGWNRAAERLFGWKAEEVLGGPVPIQTPEERANARARSETPGDRKPIEVSRLRKDGSRVDVLLAVAPVVGANGIRTGHVAIFTDLTERKLLEAQLRQSQKMEAMGTLAGGIAHDFNNILTVIMSYSNMLLASEGRSAADRADLEEIATAASRASALTRQLLTFTRKAIVRPRPIEVNDVVTGMESMLRRLLNSSIELVTRLVAESCCVVADPSQIEQIIMNLVVNASDAMPNGGALFIETKNVELDAAYARLHSGVRPGSYVMLCITDTGFGMDAATQAKIFEPFFTTKEPGRGTGLGLATVYGVVTQIGGSIWVQSEPGHGATFTIYLPRDPSTMAPAESTAAPFARRHSGTILLVEDDESVRRAVRRMLEKAGYIVLEAPDSEAAIAIATEYPGKLDAVVTDLVMPKMDGRTLAAELASIRPRTRVVFTSGYTDDALIRRGLVESPHAFLQKPFTEEQLDATLTALIGQ